MKFKSMSARRTQDVSAPQGRRRAASGLRSATASRLAGGRTYLQEGRAALGSQLDERRTSMMAVAADPVRRGSRKRAVPAAAAGFVALGAMFGMVSANMLAVNFTTGNTGFKVYSNYLDAQQAAGFLTASTKQSGPQQGLAHIGIVTAKLAGLCAIKQESVLGVGSVALKLTAGDAVPDSYSNTAVPAGVTTNASGQLSGTTLTNAISANQLYMDADALGGYGNLISGLNLGQSASTVATSAGLPGNSFPAGQAAPVAGNFGLYAQQLNVAGLDSDSYGLNLAGQITLPKLRLTIEAGTRNQTDCS